MAITSPACSRISCRWPGIARFEDPTFADDLLRARQQAARGGLDLTVNTMQALVTLATAITLVLVCMGVAGLSAWQKSRARSLALG